MRLCRYGASTQRRCMSSWDMEELVGFAVLSEAGSVIADEIWQSRWKVALGSLTKDVVGFSRAMEENGVVVSGSQALQFVDRVWGLPSGDWDFYIPHDRFDAFTSYASEVLGRTMEEWAPPEGPSDVEGDPSCGEHPVCVAGVCGRRRIVTPTGTVDMLRSCTRSALSPIPRFHSTAVMAYVGPTGFSIAYPLAAHERVNVVASRHLRPAEEAAIDKYEMCGFKKCTDIRTALRLSGSEISCVGSGFCPSQERYFGDRFCLSVSYLGPGLLGSHMQTFPDAQVVSWTRGGKGCGRTQCSGFVRPKAITLTPALFDMAGALVV